MKRNLVFWMMLLFLAVTAGCAHHVNSEGDAGQTGQPPKLKENKTPLTKADVSYLPESAMKLPYLGMSLEHLSGFQRRGVNTITLIQGILNPELRAEAWLGWGVWQAVIRLADGKLAYAYGPRLKMVWRHVPVTPVVFIYAGPRSDLEGASIIYTSRDGSRAYGLGGERILDYDPRKFDEEDPKFRDQIFKRHGLQLGQASSSLWRIPPQEVHADTPDWKALETEIGQMAKYTIIMPDDSLRWANMPAELFWRIGQNRYGLTGLERFGRDWGVSLSVSLTDLLIPGTSIIIDQVRRVVMANIDNRQGHLMSATCQREDVAFEFVVLQAEIEELLNSMRRR